jgi:N-acetylglucosaminyl-diphospho-decaprenol L-rhamnosyltransferase
MATFLLVRREAFDAVGGFDREQWMHAEDLDLGWRLTRAGWRIRYEPAAEVRHEGSAASKKAFSEDLMTRYMAASYSWMARRRGVLLAWTIAAINTLGTAVRLLLLYPLAASRPDRFGAARNRARYWLRVHRTGLRTRAALLRPH